MPRDSTARKFANCLHRYEDDETCGVVVRSGDRCEWHGGDRKAQPEVTASLTARPEVRHDVLRALLPLDPSTIRERRSDLWPLTSAGERALFRDLRAIGATPTGELCGGSPWVLAPPPPIAEVAAAIEARRAQPPAPRRTMSPEARARIAEGQRKRWEAKRASTEPEAAPPPPVAEVAAAVEAQRAAVAPKPVRSAPVRRTHRPPDPVRVALVGLLDALEVRLTGRRR